MTWFTMVAGTIIYLIVGAVIDTVMPSAHLLGMNLQALILSSASMGFALWLAVRLDLFS